MRDAWIIIGESVGKLIVFLVTIVSIFLLYVLLGDKPFGFQIATLIAYSVSVFTFVFFRWKGLNKAYSLRDKAVRRQIPRLLAIHGAFLVLVFLFWRLRPTFGPVFQVVGLQKTQGTTRGFHRD
jgi:amino acid transporter